MAGTKVNLDTRIAASSLLEVLIAMVVILIVFALALNIFVNVTRSSSSFKQLKARAILTNMAHTAEATGIAATRTTIIGDWKVEQIVKPYPANTGVTELDLTIYDENQQKITGLQQLITVKQ